MYGSVIEPVSDYRSLSDSKICTYIGLDKFNFLQDPPNNINSRNVSKGQDRTALRLSYPERLVPVRPSDNHVPMSYFLINKEFHDNFSE